MKLRVEINEIQTGKKRKLTVLCVCVCFKIHKIDKFLARITKGKKEDTLKSEMKEELLLLRPLI